ncbi:hypothetical protein VTN00DRAFT_2428 [Thermoascus crustaceus]|uniref:uncharacterized protein n=1 Tax=Thermoascus crustaceus TaxID=5088 RepID=UPI00374246D9
MHSTINRADQIREVWTSDENTMAQQTAASRWPKIVQGTIDDIGKTATAANEAQKLAESVAIQNSLKEIKNDMEQNKPLQTLPEDGGTDIKEYNTQLAVLGQCSWLNCPWLFGECYLRIQTIFAMSTHWKKHDVFKRQKDSTFANYRVAVEELASRYIQVIAEPDTPKEDMKEEARKLLFTEMTEVALWGNATDLSLLSHLSLEDLQNLQGREAISKSQRNIVDNDTDDVWLYLTRKSAQKDRRVDIVLDNAGFEFFTDLLYAAYLLDSGLASCVKFHTKDFPWFVSDVVPEDVASLFDHLGSPSIFTNRQHLDQLVTRLNRFFDSGTITVTSHPFWTTAYSFHEMPTKAQDLFEDLQASYLVIFKGDLNYRKLTKDSLWPHTTSFREALGPLGESRIKILALRTNKSDTCVGVDSQHKVDELNKEAPGGTWVRNGKYAVVSFSEGQ